MSDVLQQPSADVDVQGTFIRGLGITKVYGTTIAVNNVTMDIRPGQVIGLVGANGAGKSTLMRTLAGSTQADSGELYCQGKPIELAKYSPKFAREIGVRIVYQELSLSTNLSVYENLFLGQHKHIRGRQWRKQSIEKTKQALADVFPNNQVDPTARVENLTIAQQQMVEIARAASDPELKLLILDEPTSSLDGEQTQALIRFIRRYQEKGISFIFISHRLKEILAVCDHLLVMKNGVLVWQGDTSGMTDKDLLALMGGNMMAAEPGHAAVAVDTDKADDKPRRLKIDVHGKVHPNLQEVNMKLYEGEIIGISGLEGSGQRDLLQALYHGKSVALTKNGSIAYVSGDRAKEGVFPYWSIMKNMSITALTWPGKLSVINFKGERERTQYWFDKLKIAAPNLQAPLVSLSGGNQQKALIARALLSDADIVILDDPTRGVDVETKQQLYQLFRESADQGKLIIWYSSEDAELSNCDRVYAMNSGSVVKELKGQDITVDNLIEAYFTHVHSEEEESPTKRLNVLHTISRVFARYKVIIPLLALIIVFIAMGIARPSSISTFGLSLLIGSAIPLVLGAISQMFVITGSDIDLSVGPYMGLMNVVSATVLVSHALYGFALIVLGILAYGALGALIHLRKIPSIVATLGAYFVWLGCGLTILKEPGGSSPGWLSNLFSLNIPVVPEAVLFVLIAGLLAYFLIARTRYGVVLRGFGNNPGSIERSGWSGLKARVSLYMLAGFFGTLAGLAITGITTAADPTASVSYTLLTVAAVVMGGGELTGGITHAFGTVFGAVALSMIGALLGLLSVGSNWQPAVQGGLLFVILSLRLLGRRRSA
jgi:ribose transport system ATP-binding protein